MIAREIIIEDKKILDFEPYFECSLFRDMTKEEIQIQNEIIHLTKSESKQCE